MTSGDDEGSFEEKQIDMNNHHQDTISTSTKQALESHNHHVVKNHRHHHLDNTTDHESVDEFKATLTELFYDDFDRYGFIVADFMILGLNLVRNKLMLMLYHYPIWHLGVIQEVFELLQRINTDVLIPVEQFIQLEEMARDILSNAKTDPTLVQRFDKLALESIPPNSIAIFQTSVRFWVDSTANLQEQLHNALNDYAKLISDSQQTKRSLCIGDVKLRSLPALLDNYGMDKAIVVEDFALCTEREPWMRYFVTEKELVEERKQLILHLYHEDKNKYGGILNSYCHGVLKPLCRVFAELLESYRFLSRDAVELIRRSAKEASELLVLPNSKITGIFMHAEAILYMFETLGSKDYQLVGALRHILQDFVTNHEY